MTDDLSVMKSQLTAWLKTKMPDANNLTLSYLEKPGMGMSNETLLFDIKWEEGGQQRSRGAVLHGAPRGEARTFPEYNLAHQFHVMKNLENTDVPVAKMFWLEENPSITGAPFFLMERLYGDVPQDYPSYHSTGMYFDDTPEHRTKMWWGSLEAMAEVHKVDWRKKDFSFLGVPQNNADSIDRQIAYWENYLNWLKDNPQEKHPTMEATLDWLKENRYEPERITLCWGDTRIGNTLFSIPDRDVLAAMDWEMAFIGDPEGDLAWVVVLAQQYSKGWGLPRLPGTPEDDEIIRHYEEYTGWKVKNFFYNEVLATLRFGITVIATLKKLQKQGIPIEDDKILNNFPTQHLSELLGLPSPGLKEEVISDINQITVTIQFCFTGPGGSDWYMVADKGKGTRFEGLAEKPDCTIKVSVEDWEAIQSGKLNRLDAWIGGKLAVVGDLKWMDLLEDMMAEFARL